MNYCINLIAQTPNYVFGIAIVALWLLAGSVYYLSFPNFKKSVFIGSDGREQSRQWPFVVSNLPLGSTQCIIPIDLSILRSSKFNFYSTGELKRITINGQDVDVPTPGRSIGDYPLTLDLADTLKTGSNELKFFIQSKTDTVTARLHVAPTDSFRLFFLALVLLATGIMLTWISRFRNLPFEIGMILFIGIALRIIYCAATPYHIRNNDFWGHLPYIKYVADNLSIPSATWGWQSYQPPLYYLICGLWARLTQQQSSSWLYEQWQSFSLILSIGSFLVCWSIAKRVFKSISHRFPELIFLSFIAVFPGLLYHASRINNDSLLTALSFFWFYALVSWWNHPSFKAMIVVAIFLALALITKSNSIPLVGITSLCIIFRPKTLIAIKIKHCIGVGFICLIGGGWYHLPRLFSNSESASFLVGNWQFLQDSLKISPSFQHYTTFNLFNILHTPFNNTPGIERDAFLGYVFRTACFGEWWQPYHLYPPARMLLFSAACCFVLAGIGIFSSIKRTFISDFPFLVTFCVIISTLVVFVIKLPFACSQDFRYVTILALPLAIFITRGVETFFVGQIAVILFSLSSISFILLSCGYI